VVGAVGEVRIPTAAFSEHGFQAGEPIIYLCGSLRSDGFSVGRQEKLGGSSIPRLRRSIGRSIIHDEGQFAVPPGTGIQPGQRLLAVRGSGYAVLFATGGPIYEEALKRSDIETFPVL